MNYTKLKTAYVLLLAAGLISRIFTVMLTIDSKTGFIKQGKKFLIANTVLTAFCALCVIAVFVLALLCGNKSGLKVKGNYVGAALALLIAVFSTVDILNLKYSSFFPRWQIIAVAAVGVLNSLFFLYYAVTKVLKRKTLPLFYGIPLVFLIVKLVRFFAVTSSITIISENAFTTVYYASAILFMMHLLSYAGNYGDNRSSKYFIAFGGAASALSVISAFPTLLKFAVDKNAVAHESIYSVVLSLALGLFILTVTFSSAKD